MSELLKELYVKTTMKIDRMTITAQEGTRINRSVYNLLHQMKFEILNMQIQRGELF